MANGMVQEEGNKKLLQWVISLAVSIVCCAVLFLVFASFLLDNQRSLIKLQMQQELIQAKLDNVDANISYMMNASKRANTTSAVTPAANPAPVPAPTEAMQVTPAAPAAAAAPVQDPVPVPTPAPATAPAADPAPATTAPKP